MIWPFKRKAEAPAPETAMLPEDVTSILESAQLLTRSSQGDDGAFRVLVTFPGRRFYADDAAQTIAAYWPYLNGAQQRRARSWLASRIANHLRAEARQRTGPDGSTTARWSEWRPDACRIEYQ